MPIATVDTAFFLILRMLQATSAACIVTSRAIVRDTTNTPEASSTRRAYVTMGMAVAPMIRPTLGGYIDGGLSLAGKFLLDSRAGLYRFGIFLF